MPRPAPARTAVPAPAPAAPPFWRRDGSFALVLIAAVVVAYLPVWRAGFIWDDDSNLTQHPCIVGPLGFADIWTSPASFYFPLVMSTFWLQHALWGLAPAPYHVVNVLFHAVDGVLLWLVLRELRVPGARLGALLWALHPVQVESVAWISELKNTESAVFYLAAIGLFARWVAPSRTSPGAHGRGRLYAGALLAAVAAILAKSSTVMLPVVLGLCWWWTARTWRWRQAAWLVPFLAVSAAASGWTIWEQRYHSGALGADWNQSLVERGLLAGRAIWFYLGKLAWPHPLIFIYPRVVPDATQPASFLPAGAALGALAVLGFWRERLRPWVATAVYFGVSLFPILGFFNVYFFRYSFVGDHFQYLASMGPAALAGAGFALAAARLGRPAALAARLAVGGAVAALAVLTCGQSETYRDLPTFYQAILERNPTCVLAHYNWGKLLRSTGRLPEAIAHLEQARQVEPDATDVNTELGLALLDSGRAADSLDLFARALRADPNYAIAHSGLGRALAAAGRLPEALGELEIALRLEPASADAHLNFGNVLRASGRLPEALAQYAEAVRRDPGFALAHASLGSALAEADRLPEAVAELEEAVRLDPARPETHHKLGLVLLVAGRTPEGIAQLEEALRLDPNLGPVHLALAMALESAGRPAEAAAHYAEARRLGVELPEGRN